MEDITYCDSKEFSNGSVYLLHTTVSFPIETVVNTSQM